VRPRLRPLVLGLAVVIAAASGACRRTGAASGNTSASATARTPQRYEVVDSVYDGKLQNGWQDYGWAPRDVGKGPASVDFGKWGGWILAKPNLEGRYGALVFRAKTPVGEAEFLEVRVESPTQTVFPRIKVRAEHRLDVGDGWVEVLVPMKELDPDGIPFDRVVFRAFRDTPNQRTLLDKIALTKADLAAEAAAQAEVLKGAKPLNVTIDCRGRPRRISPWIYGAAWEASKKGDHVFRMGATARRWGGNTTSRYNWQIHAWNTANDWFFENVDIKPHDAFLAENAEHKVTTALTVPTLGWIAKDTTSYSFPVAVFGAQQKTDEWKKDAGNGNKADGKPIDPGPPSRTSIAASPDMVGGWVAALEKDTGKPIAIYILDNEPALWNSTHRDVHPEPLGYDELLDKTIAYGSAVRKSAPNALIAGPAEWGWPAYQYSAKDAKAGFFLKPDRRAHGDVPLLAWYLQKLKEHEAKTGVRVLDLVDLHFYPQGEGVFSDAADAKTAALRWRQTRGLWDPTYTDESWIKEPVMLLPRMKDWIDKNWPGRGIMIGEWSFGGEGHMSGALATAEALGRFAQYDVRAAFYWTAPPDGSPSFWGFRAYRNFDEKGGRFQDFLIPATVPTGASVFASRDEAGKHVVAIVLNPSPDAAFNVTVDASSCGALGERRVYTYAGGSKGFTKGASAKGEEKPFKETLLPYSITVFDLDLAGSLPTITEAP